MSSAQVLVVQVVFGLGFVAAFFLYLVIPVRSKRLKEKYTRFREETQAGHDAADAQFHHHDTTVGDIKWHYVEEGSSTGTPVLFLHGLPETWYSWRYVLPLISHDYRLIALDMKGYGRSDKDDNHYNWRTIGDEIVDLMDSLKAPRFYVVGHDWGAMVGSILVQDHPDRVLGFVRMQAPIDPDRFSYRNHPQGVLFLSNSLGTFMMEDAGWFIDFVYPKRMATQFQKTDRDYLVYEFSRPGVARQVPKYFAGRNRDRRAIGGFVGRDFPFPIMQLQGALDPAQPRPYFQDTTTKCPGVELRWIEGASHFDNFDRPEEVAAAINDFLSAHPE